MVMNEHHQFQVVDTEVPQVFHVAVDQAALEAAMQGIMESKRPSLRDDYDQHSSGHE